MHHPQKCDLFTVTHHCRTHRDDDRLQTKGPEACDDRQLLFLAGATVYELMWPRPVVPFSQMSHSP